MARSENAEGFKALWNDLVTLTKARLSVLVVTTSIFGYLVAAKMNGSFSMGKLWHTTVGSLLAALGAAVFNQIMEIEPDGRMKRTADRPLPANRIPSAGAFVLGFLLSAFGVVHLVMMTNLAAAAFAAFTLFVYLFVYTPLKRVSSANTIVGAVAGALPPLIGWSAGGGDWRGAGACFLFSLLFFWQLPHFAAINWMYREEYIEGGFMMWSNRDESGSRTARLALFFSACLTLVGVFGALAGLVDWPFSLAIAGAGAYMCRLAFRFLRSARREDARGLFFYTLLYLPLVLILGYFGWKHHAS